MYFNRTQGQFGRINSQQLREALDDPRLPKSFIIQPVHKYPALEIRTDDDELWYIGYIDLFDGTYHPKPKGHRDSINSVYFTGGNYGPALMMVDDPHDLPKGE